MTTVGSPERRRLLRDWIDRGAEMVRVDDTPDFLLPLISALRHAQPNQLSINDLPAAEIADRQAAVLILLGGLARILRATPLVPGCGSGVAGLADISWVWRV